MYNESPWEKNSIRSSLINGSFIIQGAFIMSQRNLDIKLTYYGEVSHNVLHWNTLQADSKSPVKFLSVILTSISQILAIATLPNSFWGLGWQRNDIHCLLDLRVTDLKNTALLPQFKLNKTAYFLYGTWKGGLYICYIYYYCTVCWRCTQIINEYINYQNKVHFVIKSSNQKSQNLIVL